ncbi:MAG TPA: peptidoglycan recognition family protein [Acidimicrobiia bacterium]|nr:peptidoglycan recognition family protein [Acidimicrobiia bacterium]
MRSVVVHHTATEARGRTAAEQVRAIYEEQLARGYGDVAYHWLIADDGTIFEGRWAQDYPLGQLHDGEDRHGNNVRGGATKHHNTETIAIALLGNFTTRVPSSAALASLVDVIAWKCARWHLSPVGVSPYLTSAGQFRHLPTLVGHRDCRVTECPGNALYALLPQLRRQVAARLADGGAARHWMAGADGLLAYGTLAGNGPSDETVAGVVAEPRGRGLWAWSSDGGVFALGGAPFVGSLGARHGADGTVTGLAPTPSGRGYWLVTAHGGVFAFGDARYFGSRGGRRLAAPVIACAPTSTGRGYRLFATDGGVFAYGDASYRGGATRLGLRAPVVAAAATPTDGGYWLAGRDGGVFAFGDARHLGSSAPGALTSPIVGIVPTARGDGYALLLADGGVIAFGGFDAAHRHEGSLLDAARGAIA